MHLFSNSIFDAKAPECTQIVGNRALNDNRRSLHETEFNLRQQRKMAF
jgi:hypothetical protein